LPFFFSNLGLFFFVLKKNRHRGNIVLNIETYHLLLFIQHDNELLFIDVTIFQINLQILYNNMFVIFLLQPRMGLFCSQKKPPQRKYRLEYSHCSVRWTIKFYVFPWFHCTFYQIFYCIFAFLLLIKCTDCFSNLVINFIWKWFMINDLSLKKF
jgi:hypothetical protein